MKKEVLTRPFPPELVKQRQGQGGKMLSYVETHAVISRLNEGCDAWSFEIIEHQILDEEVVVIGKLTADGVTKMAFGGSAITRDRDGRAVSIADDAKASASDCLKKAASLLGIALELYGAGAAETTFAQPSARAPAPASANDRLTGKQYSAIQSVARRRNIGRDLLAHMLDERFNKTEIGHLSRREASSILSELTGSNGAG
ncbi:MAG: hypothetical protein KIT84_00535 [Labilithrix sp.]|nr:hypothetical protein [Labilithrix sp.]MCW5809470.1 hypothetical protein [Labilithrix sp.]